MSRTGSYIYKIKALNTLECITLNSNLIFNRKDLLKEYYQFKHTIHPFSSLFDFIYRNGVWGFEVLLLHKKTDEKYKTIDNIKYTRNREKILQKAKIKNDTLTEKDIENRRIYRKQYRKSEAYSQYMKTFRENYKMIRKEKDSNNQELKNKNKEYRDKKKCCAINNIAIA